MDPKTDNNPYLGFIYTSFQERATKVPPTHPPSNVPGLLWTTKRQGFYPPRLPYHSLLRILSSPLKNI